MNYEKLESEFERYAELTKAIESLDMITPVDIQTGITALTKTADLIKKAKELAEKTQNVEIKEIALELRRRLVDTKSLLIDTKEEVISLKEENRELEKLQKKEIFQKKGYIYLKNNPKTPHCIRCWTNKQQLIQLRLIKTRMMGGYIMYDKYEYKCNNCGENFLDSK